LAGGGPSVLAVKLPPPVPSETLAAIRVEIRRSRENPSPPDVSQDAVVTFPIVIGMAARAWYVPAVTSSMSKWPSFRAVTVSCGHPNIVSSWELRRTIAPPTGSPASSTTIPEMRNAGAF
jgi:hypothetical protein